MPLPPDYGERVYAGVLGKLIGVYLGRPFEQWTHREIQQRLGEIRDYVTGHPAIEPAKRDNPLVVTDDDISGTFTFLRALADYGPDVTPAQIGQTWLN
jgi:ADP-ribosylglycohydrolase